MVSTESTFILRMSSPFRKPRYINARGEGVAIMDDSYVCVVPAVGLLQANGDVNGLVSMSFNYALTVEQGDIH